MSVLGVSPFTLVSLAWFLLALWLARAGRLRGKPWGGGLIPMWVIIALGIVSRPILFAPTLASLEPIYVDGFDATRRSVAKCVGLHPGRFAIPTFRAVGARRWLSISVAKAWNLPLPVGETPVAIVYNMEPTEEVTRHELIHALLIFYRADYSHNNDAFENCVTPATSVPLFVSDEARTLEDAAP